jgi:ligand-binding sensor protein/GAF domain-containing protein
VSITVVPTRRQPDWTLADLLGVEMLQAIQDSFAHAFGLPTVIVDRHGRNVTEITHRVAFCEDMTRPSSAGGHCTACDSAAMGRAAETRRPEIFHCWNGLHDSAVPIVSSEGQRFGFFLCGQVFADPPQSDRYRATAELHGIDADRYVQAAQRVRIVPRQTLEQAIECMGVLARMIADQASAAIQRLGMLEEALAANAATERLAAELDTIVGTCAAIGSTGDTVATLGLLADSIGRVIAYDSCLIFELEPDRRRLRLLAARDPYADALAGWRPEVGHGIAGFVASTGAALLLEDAARSEHFEPIPGVPIEPEAMLAVPMLLEGDVIGVITLSRFQRRTFSEHELDLVRILASQCATALGTARFRHEIGRHLALERAQGAVYRRIVAGGEHGALLEQIVRDACELLGCSAGALTLSDGMLQAPAARFRADELRLDQTVRVHGPAFERARSTLRPATAGSDEEAVLIAPIEVAGRAVAELVLWRERAFGEDDERLAAAVAQQTAVARETARVERSERQLFAGYKLLAELGSEFAAADSTEAIARLLADRAHELVGASGAFVALGDDLASELEVWSREGGSIGATSLPTAGRPHLRLPRRASASDQELFGAWAAALAGVFAARPASVIGVPLVAAGQTLGGLVAVADRPFGREDYKRLLVLANSAAGSLAAAAARRESDQTLRARAQALAALSEFAQTVTAAHDAGAVAHAVLDAFRVLSGSATAAIVVPAARGGVKIAWSLGLSPAERRELLARLPPDLLDEPEMVDDGALLAVPLKAGASCLGMIVADASAGRRWPGVLSSLARYGAIALENARLLEAERGASANLRELHDRQLAQAREFERSLAIQRALSEALLARDGLDRVAETLAALQGGSVAVLDESLKPIAGVPQPAATGLEFAEQLLARQAGGDAGLLEVALAEGHSIIAAPIRAEQDELGWIVQRLARPVGEVDRTAIVHAALAAAVAILRDRKEEEAEGRLRGELLEALFATDAPTGELVTRARALGYDITQPSRVAVAELVAGNERAGDELYRAAIAWTDARGGFLVGRRGQEIAVVGPPEDAWPHELHRELTRTAGTTRLGVGVVASSPRDHRESFLGARQATIVLRTTQRSGVLALDDPGIDQLLVRATDAGRLVAFADSIVRPLAEYDERRGSSLVPTLELVIGNGWNLQAAARDAHVHVSTLRYRLKRLETLASVDLSRPDDRLAVQLAMRVDRLLHD